MSLILATLFLLLTGSSYAQVAVTETYEHSAELRSGNIMLYWKFTDTHIAFEVHGQTTGWVGIGFSPNGAMTGADIFVGWVKNGDVVVTDRYGIGNTFPPKDPEQNIEVLAGAEEGGWTMFKFRRQLAACETNYDREITASTERLIYAWGSNDPAGDDLVSGDYHGTNRGTESMYFLEAAAPSELPVGPAYQEFVIAMDNFKVPAESTYYNCKLFRFPELTEKHHVVKIDPIVTPGNEMNVHHILVYQCGDVLANSSELGVSERCYSPNMQHFQTCSTVIASWAIGGGSITYPEIAGFSIGVKGDPIYVQMETHYDNPQVLSDIIDSSGLRLTYTNTLRKYDVGILEVGNTAIPTQHLIPPGAESYLSTGFCTGLCLSNRMKASGQSNITVFSVLLHSHLAGRQLTLRHFRDGVELPYLAYDLSYDFNYQEGRPVDPHVVVMPKDNLRMDCVYNTKGYTQMVQGGLSTKEEMCLSFVFYYPRIDLALCTTNALRTQSWSWFGIYEVNATGKGNSLEDFIVTAPEDLAGQTAREVMTSYDWTEENIDKFSEDIINMIQFQVCLRQDKREPTGFPTLAPNETQKYELPRKTCLEVTAAPQNQETTTSGAPSILNKNNFLLIVLCFLMFEQLK